MNNIVYLIGRLIDTPKIQELENGAKTTTISIAVQRSFKNADGIYETDFIPVILWDTVAQNISDYCIKGDLIGVKGRLQSVYIGDSNIYNIGKTKTNTIEIIAEKITFLSSKNNIANLESESE